MCEYSVVEQSTSSPLNTPIRAVEVGATDFATGRWPGGNGSHFTSEGEKRNS